MPTFINVLEFASVAAFIAAGLSHNFRERLIEAYKSNSPPEEKLQTLKSFLGIKDATSLTEIEKRYRSRLRRLRWSFWLNLATTLVIVNYLISIGRLVPSTD